MSKLIKEVCGFREVCESNWSDDTVVYLFYGIDVPLYKTQIAMLWDEMNEDTAKLFVKPRSKDAKRRNKWWRHLDSLGHDGYGSFRLEFNSAIMDYKESELRDLTEDIFCLINETEFMSNMNMWMGIEEEGPSTWIADADMTAEECLDWYVDYVLKCGYSVSQRELEDLFSELLTAEQIGSNLLLRKLKGENVELTEQKEAA